MKRFIGLLLLVSVFGFISCTTSIKNIRKSPEKYAGQSISVSGNVLSKTTAPGVAVGLYQIYDGTGKLYAISTAEPAFEENQDVTISGKLYYLSGSDVTETSEEIIDKVKSMMGLEDSASGLLSGSIGNVIINALKNTLESKDIGMILIEQSD